jgi:hypothetical protein
MQLLAASVLGARNWMLDYDRSDLPSRSWPSGPWWSQRKIASSVNRFRPSPEEFARWPMPPLSLRHAALQPSSARREQPKRRYQRLLLLYCLMFWHFVKMSLDSAACSSSGAAWPFLLSPDAFGGSFEASEFSVSDSAELSFVP